MSPAPDRPAHSSAKRNVGAAAPAHRPLLRRLATTPLRDALRGRVSGRLDIEALVDAARLPEPIPELILRVTRRTRLWRLEKSDVARELIAHFEDGVSAARPPADLAAAFGDPDAAAKLIRRAKRRARPFAWHVWRRALHGVAATIALLVVVYLYFAIPFWTNSPRIARNYLAELNAPAAAVAEQDRAWPVYREALLAVGEWPEAPKGVDWWSIRPGRPEWPALTAYLEDRAHALALARRAAAKPEMGYIAATGIHAADRDLWPEDFAASDAKPTDAEDSFLIDAHMPHFSSLRLLAQLLLLDARLAVFEGDHERAMANLRAVISLSQQLRSPPSSASLIQQLISVSIYAAAVNMVGETLALGAPFTDAEMTVLAHSIAAYADGRMRFDLTTERAFFQDFLQRAYSDDGAGDGRITAEGLRLLMSMSARSDTSTGLSTYAFGPAAAAWLAGRAEMSAKYSHLMDMIDAEAALPLWRRETSPVAAEISRMNGSFLESARYSPITILMPAVSRVAFNAEIITQLRDAALVAIALELHYRRSGAWPASLDELVPTLLPAVPPDRFDGAPLRYRLVDGAPRVYSVGPDKHDDGGRPATATFFFPAQFFRAGVEGLAIEPGPQDDGVVTFVFSDGRTKPGVDVILWPPAVRFAPWSGDESPG